MNSFTCFDFGPKTTTAHKFSFLFLRLGRVTTSPHGLLCFLFFCVSRHTNRNQLLVFKIFTHAMETHGFLITRQESRNLPLTLNHATRNHHVEPSNPWSLELPMLNPLPMGSDVSLTKNMFLKLILKVHTCLFVLRV